jgi:hypothetical protein
MRTSSPSRRSVPESARGSALVEGVLPLVTGGDPRCDLCARAEAELAEDPREMRLHGLLAQEQLPGDLAVGTSGSHELGDLALPGARRLESLLPRRPAPARPTLRPSRRSSRTASSRSRCDPDAAAWRSAAVSCAIAASRSPAANARPPITRPRAASSARRYGPHRPPRPARALRPVENHCARAPPVLRRAQSPRGPPSPIFSAKPTARAACLGGLQIPDSEVGFHEHGSPRTDPARRATS